MLSARSPSACEEKVDLLAAPSTQKKLRTLDYASPADPIFRSSSQRSPSPSRSDTRAPIFRDSNSRIDNWLEHSIQNTTAKAVVTEDDPDGKDDLDDKDNWDNEDDEDEGSVVSSDEEMVVSAPLLPLDQLLEQNLPETIDQGISRQRLLEHMPPLVQDEAVRVRVIHILERMLYFIDDRRLARLTQVKENSPHWQEADLDFILKLIHYVKVKQTAEKEKKREWHEADLMQKPHIMASIYYILDQYDIKAISAADVIERFVLLHSSFARMFCLISFIRSRIHQDVTHTTKNGVSSGSSKEASHKPSNYQEVNHQLVRVIYRICNGQVEIQSPITVLGDSDDDADAVDSLLQGEVHGSRTTEIHSNILDDHKEEENDIDLRKPNDTTAITLDDGLNDLDSIVIPQLVDEENAILRELSNIEDDDDSFFTDALGDDNDAESTIPEQSLSLKSREDTPARPSVVIDLSDSQGSKRDEDMFGFYQELMGDEDNW